MQLQVSYKQIWQLAYPLMLSSVAINITNIMNTAFLSRVSETDLGASAVGGVFYFSLVMICTAIAIGAQIMIARKMGEGHTAQVPHLVDHAAIILLVMCTLFWIFIRVGAQGIFSYLLHSEYIIQSCMKYLHYRSWGLWFSVGNVLYRGFYTGIGRTKPITVGIFIMSVVNIVLDYVLILGKCGFQPMGIAGAGIASNIAEFCSLLYFVVFSIVQQKNNIAFRFFTFNQIQRNTFKEMINLSLPMMFQNMISLGAWFLFFVVIEQLGQHPLAISNIVRSLYMLLMTPLWGFASATTTVVSNIIGQGKHNEVMTVIYKTVKIGLLSCTIICISDLLFPELWLHLFTNDSAIIADAVPVVKLLALFMFFFSTSVIFLSGLSGTGDTKAALVIEITTIITYLFYLYYTAIVQKASLGVVWCAELEYWILIGLLAYARLRYMAQRQFKTVLSNP